MITYPIKLNNKSAYEKGYNDGINGTGYDPPKEGVDLIKEYDYGYEDAEIDLNKKLKNVLH